MLGTTRRTSLMNNFLDFWIRRKFRQRPLWLLKQRGLPSSP
jgi:hypothetical protein